MNIVEFALKFKDLASSELGKFGNTARTTFNNASKLADNVTGHNKTLGSSYNELQKQIESVENRIRNSKIKSEIREARQELALLQRQSNRHIGNIDGGKSGGTSGMLGIASLGKFAAPAAIAAVGYKAGEFLGEAMSKSLERQQILTSFSVLAGGKGSGDALSKDLIKYQKETILGPEVFKNAQTMMGFGFKSTEVMDNLKMLGDVSMGDADKLGNLTLAFSQTRAAGKLTGQDLLQYINAGFNPLEEISKRTGKSIGQLKEDMGNGGVSFAMVQQAFKDATSEGGKFNNMLETIAQTPAGKMQALSGAWNEFKINAGAAFMPLISEVLGLANDLLPLLEQVIVPFAAWIQKTVTYMRQVGEETGGVMTYVSIIKDYFQNGIIPFAQKLFYAFFHIVGKLAEFIAKSELIRDFFIGILNIVSALIDSIVWLFDNIVMPILKVVEYAYRLLKGSSTTVKIKKTTENGTDVGNSTNTDLLSQTAKNTAANAESAKNTEKAITGGGPKNIYITVQKFFDDMNISTTNMNAAAGDMEKMFLEMFARVVSQGARAI